MSCDDRMSDFCTEWNSGDAVGVSVANGSIVVHCTVCQAIPSILHDEGHEDLMNFENLRAYVTDNRETSGDLVIHSFHYLGKG